MGLTIRSRGCRFAAPLNSGVRRGHEAVVVRPLLLATGFLSPSATRCSHSTHSRSAARCLHAATLGCARFSADRVVLFVAQLGGAAAGFGLRRSHRLRRRVTATHWCRSPVPYNRCPGADLAVAPRPFARYLACLTTHSSRRRFAARLNSGVRPLQPPSCAPDRLYIHSAHGVHLVRA